MSQRNQILVTGAAAFIGSKICKFLLTKPDLIPQLDNKTIRPSNHETIRPSNHKTMRQSDYTTIVGIDNMNDYYDVVSNNGVYPQT